MRIIHFSICLYVAGLLFIPLQDACAQATDRVEFTVRTSTPNGNYSPKNIGAIWIEDANGDFVKTVKLWANRRKQYLYTWMNTSGDNTVDAVTGATISSHQTHSVTWDYTDINGDRVSDGTYTIKIEMTDRHAQGPMASFDFPVGAQSGSLTPPDETYYHDIQLDWFGATVGIGDEGGENPSGFDLSQNYPNPFNPGTTIRFNLPTAGKATLTIFDVQGRKVATLLDEQLSQGQHTALWSAVEQPSGIYFYTLVSEGQSETRRMLLIK